MDSKLKAQEVLNKIKRVNEINRLKRQLAATDYRAIKYAEGVISETDYAPIRAERQRIRSEINALETPEPPKPFIY